MKTIINNNNIIIEIAKEITANRCTSFYVYIYQYTEILNLYLRIDNETREFAHKKFAKKHYNKLVKENQIKTA